MDVVRPDWWPYPERCEHGHEWGPDRVLVVWQRCWCQGAQMLHEDRAIWGHFTVACREPGCRAVWYDPPHEPGTDSPGSGHHDGSRGAEDGDLY